MPEGSARGTTALALLGLLPADSSILIEKVQQALKATEVDAATLYRLKQTCNLLYLEKYTDALIIAEEIIDYSWEMLNTGNWKDVPESWRIAYSFASLLKAVSTALLKGTSNAGVDVCLICDMALLMGAPILDGIFNRVIDIYKPSEKKQALDLSDSIVKKRKLESVQLSDAQIRDGHEVELVECPSLNAFEERYMKTETPVILTSCLDHWPASSRWNPDYIKELAGHRTVPVEIGLKYTDDDWGQKLMTIGDFVDKFITAAGPAKSGYLAQHQLFDQIPELRNDINIPDYCCLSNQSNFDTDIDVEINAWFGPKGTVSPCHHDPKHNLLAQVFGRKYVRLYPFKYSQGLYPRGDVLNNTSLVDVENTNLENFPLFKDVDAHHSQEHVLLPGQMLYIPPKHWHYVRSLDCSFSVSFWWQ